MQIDLIKSTLYRLEGLMYGYNFEVKFGIEIFANCDSIDECKARLKKTFPKSRPYEATLHEVDKNDFWQDINECLAYRGDESGGYYLGDENQMQIEIEQKYYTEFLRDFLSDSSKIFGIANGLNALNGALLLSVMALPTIITISEDAINAVPQTHREASLALGANKWETLFKVTLPAALPGLIAAVMLGLGRALGETMTVLMATGNASVLPRGFLDAVRTITATIAIEMGEVPYQTPHYFQLFAISVFFFIIIITALPFLLQTVLIVHS